MVLIWRGDAAYKFWTVHGWGDPQTWGTRTIKRVSAQSRGSVSLTKDHALRLLPWSCSCDGCTIVGPCPPTNRIQCRDIPKERPDGNVLDGVEVAGPSSTSRGQN